MKKGDLVYIIAEDAVAIFLEKYKDSDFENVIFHKGEEWVFADCELQTLEEANVQRK